MPPHTSPPNSLDGKSADPDPLLGNAYLLGSPDRKKGPHCMFTFRSIDAVIAARLTPDQLPHSIYDTPPRRVVMPNRVIIESVEPEPFLSLNHAANVRYKPGWSKLLDIWGGPVFPGYRFPLPELPKRRNRTHGSRTGAETQLSVTREEKSDVGKGEGKGIVARRDSYRFDKCRELPSVAAHSPWCARDDARVGSSGSRKGHVFNRYRELPSVHAHRAWCARTSIGDDDGIEPRDGGAGYVFERYSELPSVLAHTAWCKRTDDGDEEEVEEEDDEQTEEEDDEGTEKEDDEGTEKGDGEDAEKEDEEEAEKEEDD